MLGCNWDLGMLECSWRGMYVVLSHLAFRSQMQLLCFFIKYIKHTVVKICCKYFNKTVWLNCLDVNGLYSSDTIDTVGLHLLIFSSASQAYICEAQRNALNGAQIYVHPCTNRTVQCLMFACFRLCEEINTHTPTGPRPDLQTWGWNPGCSCW